MLSLCIFLFIEDETMARSSRMGSLSLKVSPFSLNVSAFKSLYFSLFSSVFFSSVYMSHLCLLFCVILITFTVSQVASIFFFLICLSSYLSLLICMTCLIYLFISPILFMSEMEIWSRPRHGDLMLSSNLTCV